MLILMVEPSARAAPFPLFVDFMYLFELRIELPVCSEGWPKEYREQNVYPWSSFEGSSSTTDAFRPFLEPLFLERLFKLPRLRGIEAWLSVTLS